MKRNEVLVDTTKADGPCKNAKWKTPDIEGHILYDSIYRNIQNRSVLRENAEWWLPGAEGKGKENRVSFWGKGNVLELGRSSTCTML